MPTVYAFYFVYSFLVEFSHPCVHGVRKNYTGKINSAGMHKISVLVDWWIQTSQFWGDFFFFKTKNRSWSFTLIYNICSSKTAMHLIESTHFAGLIHDATLVKKYSFPKWQLIVIELLLCNSGYGKLTEEQSIGCCGNEAVRVRSSAFLFHSIE